MTLVARWLAATALTTPMAGPLGPRSPTGPGCDRRSSRLYRHACAVYQDVQASKGVYGRAHHLVRVFGV